MQHLVLLHRALASASNASSTVSGDTSVSGVGTARGAGQSTSRSRARDRTSRPVSIARHIVQLDHGSIGAVWTVGMAV